MTMIPKSLLGKIVSWRPFRAKGIYKNDDFEYRFTCPRCKSHNARKTSRSSGNNFFQGNYVCDDCGLSEYEQNGIGGKMIAAINYYSNCFHRVEKHPTLF